MQSTSSKKRKGGLNQRIQAARAESQPSLQSELATWITSQVLWGLMSSQMGQHIAMLAQTDIERACELNAKFDDLRSIASCGTQGKFSNNVHRDFMTMLDKQKCFLLAPARFPMRFQFPDGVFDQMVLLPHEMFAAIYHYYPQTWQKIICSSADELEKFWNLQDGNILLEDNPLTDIPNYKRRAVPLGLHGDEVPVVGKGKVWSKSSLTFQWISLLGVGPGKESCIWIWNTFEMCCAAAAGSLPSTLDTFLEIIAWSFLWLYKGLWPSHNWDGKRFKEGSDAALKAGMPLANGMFGYLYGILGDLDYLHKTLKLPRYSSKKPCAQCACEIHGARTFKDNRPNAPWLSTIVNPSDWKNNKRSSNELFNLPGISCHNLCYDFMHCKYLGSDQYILGSLLYFLCFSVMAGAPKQNLQRIWLWIKAFYRNNKSFPRVYRYLNKLSMFVRKKDFPKLRGKAGELLQRY